jgi:hypothetical protein
MPYRQRPRPLWYERGCFSLESIQRIYRLNSVELYEFSVLYPGGKALKKRPKTTRPGTVEKIIKSPFPKEPEKAEIAIEGADELFREIRIENALEDEDGKKVKLKVGAQVEVTVEADPKDTIPKGGG